MDAPAATAVSLWPGYTLREDGHAPSTDTACCDERRSGGVGLYHHRQRWRRAAGHHLALARQRPDGHFTGIESAPLPFALAWLRLRFAGLANVKLLFGDYRSHGLGEYDVVYTFLSPVPMPDLCDQAKQEMKSGSLLISNTFDVPGHPADETVEVADRRQTSLYLWRL